MTVFEDFELRESRLVFPPGRGGSQQWKASTGKLLEQLTRLDAHVLLLGWCHRASDGISKKNSRFCVLPMAEVLKSENGPTHLDRPLLTMNAESLDKAWGFGKAARVVECTGLPAAVERAFKRYSKKA